MFDSTHPCALSTALPLLFLSSLQVIMELVPYDPNLDHLFFGEEISMAARLFTHGGVFFSPPQTIIYHLWSRDHRPSPPLPQSSIETKERDEREAMKKRIRMKSQHVVLDMLRGRDESPQSESLSYGLGHVRTIADYEHLLNLSFQDLKTQLDEQRSLYSESIFANDSLGLETAVQSPLDPRSGSSAEVGNTIKVLNLVQSFLI
jgi:hypothetical protein